MSESSQSVPLAPSHFDFSPARQRFRLAAAAVVVAISAVTFACASVVAPAAAAESEMLLSTDGRSFSSGVSGLLDDDRLLVPGGSISTSLWIRNPTSMPSVVRISMADVSVPSSWAGEATMTVRDSGTGQTRTAALETVADCDVIVPSQPIGVGSTVRADISFTLGDPAGLVGQGERMHMNFVVAMRDAAAGAFPVSGCTDDGLVVPIIEPETSTAAAVQSVGQDRMANTGGDLPWPLVTIGALAIGAGLSLVSGRRRGRDETGRPTDRMGR